ncbi:MAG TPA: DinB family protein [Gemmatimonadaceae bacterium]|nr:DinB family protein [Gemmatimonadaceae bacterium]
MSEFSNPASAGGAAAASYTASLLELLNGRDPLEAMREMPSKLAAAVQNVSPNLLGEPEAPGKWSIRQVVQHLADSELVGSGRFRMVLAEERPALAAYDQDAWSDRLHYSEANVDESLADFTSLRRANLRLFERTSDADRARVGVHSERGEESLALMMKLYAAHDLVHLRQIERIRGALER